MQCHGCDMPVALILKKYGDCPNQFGGAVPKWVLILL